jgi:hypothetical protein
MITKKTVLPKAIFKTLAVASLFAISLPASADREDRHGGDGWHEDRHDGRHEGRHEGFRGGGDIHRFDRHDYDVWRSGEWRHTRHENRLGWWWVAGGLWYFYPRVVYSPPDPYIPPIVVTQPTQPAAPPPAQYWYFCTSSNSYYPYVASCPDGWKTVPATPPAPSPGVPAQ